jgi:hypothetical protein
MGGRTKFVFNATEDGAVINLGPGETNDVTHNRAYNDVSFVLSLTNLAFLPRCSR